MPTWGILIDTIQYKKWLQVDLDTVKLFSNVFDICYYKEEMELKQLFEQPFSEDIIEGRVRTLNKYYHTRLWEEQIETIIDYLKDKGATFEAEIRQGDINSVRMIASCDGGNKFVFATKYCSFLNSEYYPICDALIGGMLEYCQREDTLYSIDKVFSIEKIKENKDYETFKSIIIEFRKRYKLEECPFKDVDKYLWLMGKNRDIDT